MRIICLIVLHFWFISVNAQSGKNSNSVEVSFLFPQVVAKDSSDLDFKILYRNNNSRIDSVYKYFVEGYTGDEDCNLHIQMEKLKDGKYAFYPLSYYQKIDKGYERTDEKCKDFPKKAIAAFSSDTIVFNLLQAGHLFEEGKYRFKAFVRTGCRIENNTGVPENPPFPKIEYTESQWMYFEVVKMIYKK